MDSKGRRAVLCTTLVTGLRDLSLRTSLGEKWSCLDEFCLPLEGFSLSRHSWDHLRLGRSVSLAQTEPAPDLASRIDSLEKQLADLRTQMEAQKAAATAAPAPAPAAAVLPAATPAAAPAPTGLAGLLGPTTLSGFVDVYYGYNSNQPAGRTTAFRNFDINSGQFGLNMIELVADKAPDATASRLGYHVALGFGQAMNIINSTEPGQFPTESNFDQYLKEGYLEYLAP